MSSHLTPLDRLERSRYLDRFNKIRPYTPQQEMQACKEILELETKFWAVAVKSAYAEPVFGAWFRETGIEFPVWDRDMSVFQERALVLIRNDPDREIYREVLRRIEALRLVRVKVWKSKVLKLARAIAKAKADFVERNVRLVAVLARRNVGVMGMQDMMQEGCIGLMRALNRFDLSRGFRFSTFASFWVRAVIGRSVADQGRTIRSPVHLLDAVSSAAKKLGIHQTKTGQKMSPEELAALCPGMSVAKAEDLISLTSGEHFKLFSLDDHLPPSRADNGSDLRLYSDVLSTDQPSAEDVLIRKESEISLTCLQRLTPIESRIVRWRCGIHSEELNMREIGETLNLSRERVRQIYEQAMRRLRRAFHADGRAKDVGDESDECGDGELELDDDDDDDADDDECDDDALEARGQEQARA
jgi:RNA polymerase primary sigma factor